MDKRQALDTLKHTETCLHKGGSKHVFDTAFYLPDERRLEALGKHPVCMRPYPHFLHDH